MNANGNGFRWVHSIASVVWAEGRATHRSGRSDGRSIQFAKIKASLGGYSLTHRLPVSSDLSEDSEDSEAGAAASLGGLRRLEKTRVREAKYVPRKGQVPR